MSGTARGQISAFYTFIVDKKELPVTAVTSFLLYLRWLTYILWGRRSDRTGERIQHAAIASIVCAVSWFRGAMLHSPILLIRSLIFRSVYHFCFPPCLHKTYFKLNLSIFDRYQGMTARNFMVFNEVSVDHKRRPHVLSAFTFLFFN